jgi:hypothetical protein
MHAINRFEIEGDKAYLSLTLNQKTVIDRVSLEKVLEHRWYALRVGNTFYATAFIRNPNSKRKCIYLHRFLFPEFTKVDHIDRNGLNNCRFNLREGKDINHRNQGFYRHNTSNFKGVSWDKEKKKWQAKITFRLKQYHLGRFNTREEAARVYDEAVRKFFPAGAYLNFP